MHSTQQPAVTLADLSFTWPDGTTAFSDLSATLPLGRTGLIGPNGTGKTTLLRIIAGELVPSAGSVTVTGHLGCLPQRLVLDTGADVAGLLGIESELSALRAIESGDADPAHFDAIADNWDVEARARAAMDRVGLTDIELDRPIGTLSGRETVLAALTGLALAGDEVVLLDEPTNTLDRVSRSLLYAAIDSWRGHCSSSATTSNCWI